MSTSTAGEQLKIARLVASQAGRALWAEAAAGSRVIAMAGARTPERLVLAPQELRTADPTVAEEIYGGYYTFAGKIVNVRGESPFEVDSPSPGWADELAGFSWLRHLRAADTALARSNGRALVDDWIAAHGSRFRGEDWRPDTVARRMLSWLAQSPLLLSGADAAFHRRFMRALGRHAAALRQGLFEGVHGQGRLLALIALAEYSLCAAGCESLEERTTPRLEAEIGAQILADGGHLDRNPQTLVDLLLDLLPLRQIYLARGVEAPTRLFNAIDRMTPMLRMFRHGGGELALFNGAGATQPEALAAVLAYDDVRAKPIVNAPYSGYQRLEALHCALVMDTGPPPPPLFSKCAHASALAFELSSGAHRLVVNCGALQTARPDLRDAFRATAAHSTLVVADTSSCRFASHAGLDGWLPGQLLSGPDRVTTKRSEIPNATVLEASHNGYERRFGLIHRRTLRLHKNASRLEGEDRLERGEGARRAPSNPEYAVRFHLHPATQPAVQPDGAIDLALPDGQVWRFACDDVAPLLEESIFSGGAGVRQSRQIALRCKLNEAAILRWSFERMV